MLPFLRIVCFLGRKGRNEGFSVLALLLALFLSIVDYLSMIFHLFLTDEKRSREMLFLCLISPRSIVIFRHLSYMLSWVVFCCLVLTELLGVHKPVRSSSSH